MNSKEHENRIIDIAAGEQHSLILRKDGSVYAFGHSKFGQVGLEPIKPFKEVTPNPIHIDLEEGEDVVGVEAGHQTSFALTNAGRVFGWGRNRHSGHKYQLGVDSDAEIIVGATEVELPEEIRVAQLSAGKHHGLGVTFDGGVVAWGSNKSDQLGVENLSGSSPPVRLAIFDTLLSGDERVVAVEAGEMHSLAVTNNNRLFAWGHNKHWQSQAKPFLNKPKNLPIPTEITDHRPIGNGSVLLAAGYTMSIATRIKHEVDLDVQFATAWGKERNQGGGKATLGDGENDGYSVGWVEVNWTLPSTIRMISCTHEHVLCSLVDGTVGIWGSNINGIGGVNERHVPEIYVPAQVKQAQNSDLLFGISKVAAGTHHSLGLDQSGQLWAWGKNDKGQFGAEVENSSDPGSKVFYGAVRTLT